MKRILSLLCAAVLAVVGLGVGTASADPNSVFYSFPAQYNCSGTTWNVPPAVGQVSGTLCNGTQNYTTDTYYVIGNPPGMATAGGYGGFLALTFDAYQYCWVGWIKNEGTNSIYFFTDYDGSYVTHGTTTAGNPSNYELTYANPGYAGFINGVEDVTCPGNWSGATFTEEGWDSPANPVTINFSQGQAWVGVFENLLNEAYV